ncbi:hypothetical protein BV22DRAFT_1134346 [Leucogyrophana mollusca]|uniref:Uncharacterized protein n=1 Tax=Leucogyrophana mollusca TaxID=85980 RepID=A0ACB8AZT8_9AGAM|nr:hypothetical protein BV22DRAFT_1134346 [Leucogyrophana mollusca]
MPRAKPTKPSGTVAPRALIRLRKRLEDYTGFKLSKQEIRRAKRDAKPDRQIVPEEAPNLPSPPPIQHLPSPPPTQQSSLRRDNGSLTIVSNMRSRGAGTATANVEESNDENSFFSVEESDDDNPFFKAEDNQVASQDNGMGNEDDDMGNEDDDMGIRDSDVGNEDDTIGVEKASHKIMDNVDAAGSTNSDNDTVKASKPGHDFIDDDDSYQFGHEPDDQLVHKSDDEYDDGGSIDQELRH